MMSKYSMVGYNSAPFYFDVFQSHTHTHTHTHTHKHAHIYTGGPMREAYNDRARLRGYVQFNKHRHTRAREHTHTHTHLERTNARSTE